MGIVGFLSRRVGCRHDTGGDGAFLTVAACGLSIPGGWEQLGTG